MVINIDLDVSFSVPFSTHALLVHLYYGTNKKGNNHYYIKEWISLEAVYVNLVELQNYTSPDGDISLVERVGKGKIADTRVKLDFALF
ncbi:hypothetical protein RIR_jg4055.t1 [Rhizophagus irregularis DAOM 181602=DAOM 197198]|nr:hypothetical protein RIR_jg4055.t1 [Rhizophagus irregularis DAOM 181602=DAOM 197198]